MITHIFLNAYFKTLVSLQYHSVNAYNNCFIQLEYCLYINISNNLDMLVHWFHLLTVVATLL